MSIPSETDRPSPQGKRVSLFVTCIAEMLYPSTALSVIRLLEDLGIRVDVPRAQTCCGQVGYNTGYWRESRDVARHYLKTFQASEVVVAPSGSCVAMVRREYPLLFEGMPELALAEDLASKTWEFTEYLVDGLGITDLGLAFPEQRSFAFHDSCHGLRMLGLGQAGRTLLQAVDNAQLFPLVEHDECCGFGGTFAVKMADVSGAILQRKLAHINACPAERIVVGDLSCLAHINGGLSRQGSPKTVSHIADVLAEALADGR